MLALTLTQPWATLVALGEKRIETRSWTTSHRGILAIHAAKAMPRFAREFAYHDPIGRWLNEHGIHLGGDCVDLPRGAMVAVVELVACIPTDDFYSPDEAQDFASHWVVPGLGVGVYDMTREALCGDFAPGRWAWLFGQVSPFDDPIPVKGRLGLWDWTGAPGESGVS